MVFTGCSRVWVSVDLLLTFVVFKLVVILHTYVRPTKVVRIWLRCTRMLFMKFGIWIVIFFLELKVNMVTIRN